jgi:hypothetical protein
LKYYQDVFGGFGMLFWDQSGMRGLPCHRRKWLTVCFRSWELSTVKLQKSAEILQKSYPKDLDISFTNEVIQFQ